MRPVIVLFAKAPVPGRVKTRLSSVATSQQLARLHEAFVADTLETLASLQHLADFELHTDIVTDAWPDAGVTRALQSEGDLGLKMLHALSAALRSGRPRAMILGSDAPTLQPSYIHDLLTTDSDVSLGPTKDGGYYAISCQRIHPEMFQGVAWSTADSLRQTVEACRRCGLSTHLGQAWYDIDLPTDLARLSVDPGLPRHSRACLSSLPVPDRFFTAEIDTLTTDP